MIKQGYVLDHFAFFFFILAVISTFFFELLIVCPSIESSLTTQAFHWISGIFILHNVLGNFLMIIKKQSSIKGLVLPSKLSPDWKYCLACESSCPPRSYHCVTCNICILKRDHHCLFACKCIGYFNFRYFISLLLYLSMGSIYASTLNMFYIWNLLGGFTFYTFFYHTFPFVFWLFGQISFYSMISSIVSILNISSFLFTSSLIFYYTSNLVKNQTSKMILAFCNILSIYLLNCFI